MDKPTTPRGAQPNCKRCAHYFVTHTLPFAHGCRALNFKSARLPCLDVLASSGEPCHYFTPKRGKPNQLPAKAA
ncbi:MAG: hypothetical protein JO218_05700 [Burkholderiales bacterium]|nr:hypothetical protein [Burkholderiales bacterium]